MAAALTVTTVPMLALVAGDGEAPIAPHGVALST